MKRTILLISGAIMSLNTMAQQNPVSKVWVSDLGNGKYRNPVINADYSDPDAIRVGDDFYMIASSFDAIPGLPILHSKDLVNWELSGHALLRQPPFAHFAKTQHGNGVWAPAIRYHNGEFYIYYPDPDFGIYLIKAKTINGPWSDPLLVEAGKGLIDPCPLWDDDGKVYLVHGWAGSRAGIKSIITVKEMNSEGTQTLDNGVLVYDGHEKDPTIEGPKFYKRNGYYYIFAPAGGVSTGWQVVLRSKSVYGPYDRRVVMDEGNSGINGPHQGAWVNTPGGEDWFLHFQDKGVYGRVVHLQPMKWIKDWPVIGEDKDNDGKGQPIMVYNKPDVGKTYPIVTPPESDEFNDIDLGKQWQWQANPSGNWHTLSNTGTLRLYSWMPPDSVRNFWDVPNLLLQKTPADSFVATTSLHFYPNEKLEAEETGVIVMGRSYARLYLSSSKSGLKLRFATCIDANKGKTEKTEEIKDWKNGTIQLRIVMHTGGKCIFSYSDDGKKFREAGSFQSTEGQWIGAKLGIFCTRNSQINDSGYADYDWFRVTPLQK